MPIQFNVDPNEIDPSQLNIPGIDPNEFSNPQFAPPAAPPAIGGSPVPAATGGVVSGTANPTPEIDPVSLLQKIKEQRDALSQKEMAMLSDHTKLGDMPRSREQILGAALQAAIPALIGYAGGGSRGGADAMAIGNKNLTDYLGQEEAENKYEADRDDKVKEFGIQQGEKSLDTQQSLAAAELKRQEDLEDKEKLSDVDFEKKRSLAEAKGETDGPQKQQKTVSKWTDQLQAQDDKTKFSSYKQALQTADNALVATGPSSATSMIEAFGKSLGQPNLSLREAALRMAQDSQSPYQKLWGEISKYGTADAANMITPEAKLDMYHAVVRQFESARGDLIQNSSGIMNQMKQANVDPNLVFGDRLNRPDFGTAGQIDRSRIIILPQSQFGPQGFYLKQQDGSARLVSPFGADKTQSDPFTGSYGAPRG